METREYFEKVIGSHLGAEKHSFYVLTFWELQVEWH